MTDETPTAADWEPVRMRDLLLKLADRLTETDPDGPAKWRSIVHLANELSKDESLYVLAGMYAVMPTSYDGETRQEYAGRLREAMSR